MKTHITRKLRSEQTPWEWRLWSALRNRNLSNLKFRRQVKVGNYVVDFLCLSAKIVVELDGGHHNTSETKVYDEKRRKYLESLGYTVLRFWNRELDDNLDGVVNYILYHSQPHPTPLPNGRGTQ